MPRPKKDYVLFNMRVDRTVMERFNEYCEEVGQTKTLAFERIVSAYLDQYEEDKLNLEEFKKEYELGDDVTGETQWKDVRNVVDEATRKAREEYEKQAAEAEKQQSTSDDTADSADNGTAGETEE